MVPRAVRRRGSHAGTVGHNVSFMGGFSEPEQLETMQMV
jgi:hypothetical protein